MTVSGELCCVALPFCCVVVVALPFSASLEGLFIAHGYTIMHMACMYMHFALFMRGSALLSNVYCIAV